MKKIFLIVVMTSIVATAWAQQLSTVRGKTKENKTLTVQYYPGSFEDRIESVKYQLVDELQSTVKTLQNNVRDLQSRLDAANKQVKQLNNELKQPNKPTVTPELQQQLEAKEEEIAQLTTQIDSLNTQLGLARKETADLQAEIDQMIEASRQQNMKKDLNISSPVVGIEVGFGPTVLNNGVKAPWIKDINWSKHLAVYFGTESFTESLPLSIEAGIGFNMLPVSAYLYQYEKQITNQTDNDGDGFTACYSFDSLAERLSTASIGIPIRLCIGQPIKGKGTMYAKIGVTPSFILSSTFTRVGQYTLKGHYDQWGVTLEDIEELGFHTDKACDESMKVKALRRFNLWGNVAVGAYLPLGSSLMLNMGLKVDYPLIGAGTFDSEDGDALMPHWEGLLSDQHKPLVASFELGIVYTLR